MGMRNHPPPLATAHVSAVRIGAAEKVDAELYASNVRAVMARASGRVVFAHSVFDKLLYSAAVERQVCAWCPRHPWRVTT